jgi:hypothetical protein
MHRNRLLLRLLILLLVGGLATLFVLQNAGASAALGLNLGFRAWRFTAPQPVAPLMLASLGVGLVAGGGWGLLRASASNRRARRLEQEIALSSPASHAPEPTQDEDWV